MLRWRVRFRSMNAGLLLGLVLGIAAAVIAASVAAGIANTAGLRSGLNAVTGVASQKVVGVRTFETAGNSDGVSEMAAMCARHMNTGELQDDEATGSMDMMMEMMDQR